MKTLKEILSVRPTETEEPLDLGAMEPKPEDEKKFVKVHKVRKRGDANGNDDDVFKGITKKHSDPRHGYEHPQDKAAYFAPAGVKEEVLVEGGYDIHPETARDILQKHDAYGDFNSLSLETQNKLTKIATSYPYGISKARTLKKAGDISTDQTIARAFHHHLIKQANIKEEIDVAHLKDQMEFHAKQEANELRAANKMAASAHKGEEIDPAMNMQTASAMAHKARLHAHAANIAYRMLQKEKNG